MKNCKLRFVFPNSLNLYVLGLQATEILIRSMLYFALFNFFCNHFISVSEPNINLDFYKYNAITRTDSSSNIIKFSAYYFGNYVLLIYSLYSSFHHLLHYTGPKKDLTTTVK